MLISSLCGAEVTGNTTINLVEGDPQYNDVVTTLSIISGGTSYPSDPENTIITGSMDIDLTIDTSTDTVTNFRINSGRTFNSNTSFIRNKPFDLSFQFDLENISSSVFTNIAESHVTDPATGAFTNSDHTFTVDTGTFSGWTKQGFAAKDPIEERNFQTNPGGGPGQGTGFITLQRTGEAGGEISYTVDIIIPVSSDKTEVVDEAGNQLRTVSEGSLLARGSIMVPETPYIGWTLSENIPGAPIEGDINQDGVCNLISWALGLSATADATSHLPATNAGGSYTIDLPPGGTAGEILIETSSTLGAWAPLEPTRCSLGVNPLPIGSSGTVTISSSGLPSEFIRYVVVE